MPLKGAQTTKEKLENIMGKQKKKKSHKRPQVVDLGPPPSTAAPQGQLEGTGIVEEPAPTMPGAPLQTSLSDIGEDTEELDGGHDPDPREEPDEATVTIYRAPFRAGAFLAAPEAVLEPPVSKAVDSMRQILAEMPVEHQGYLLFMIGPCASIQMVPEISVVEA